MADLPKDYDEPVKVDVDDPVEALKALLKVDPKGIAGKHKDEAASRDSDVST